MMAGDQSPEPLMSMVTVVPSEKVMVHPFPVCTAESTVTSFWLSFSMMVFNASISSCIDFSSWSSRSESPFTDFQRSESS